MGIINNKKYIIIGVVIAIVVIAVIFSWQKDLTSQDQKSQTAIPGQPIKPKGQDAFRPENAKALGTVEGGTREVISKKIETPSVETSTSTVSADIAIPVSAIPIGTSLLRRFEMKGENGKFTPSTFIVDENDIIEIKFTAVDGDYSLSFTDYGVYKLIKSGATEKLQFQASPFGEYKFVCKDVCKKEVVGKLIVNQKK